MFRFAMLLLGVTVIAGPPFRSDRQLVGRSSKIHPGLPQARDVWLCIVAGAFPQL